MTKSEIGASLRRNIQHAYNAMFSLCDEQEQRYLFDFQDIVDNACMAIEERCEEGYEDEISDTAIGEIEEGE